MKTLTKLSLAVALLATLGSTAALADDQQLRNRLDMQRAQDAKNQRTTTVGVYAGDRGLGRTHRRADDRRSETRFELRSNAHGQTFGVWVPVK